MGELILFYPLCSENWRDTKKSAGVGETASVGENKTFLLSHHTGDEGRRCSQSHSQQPDFQEFYVVRLDTHWLKGWGRDLASKPTSDPDHDHLVTLGNSASLRAQWG